MSSNTLTVSLARKPVGDLARCDRCGAAGKVRVLLPGGTDLVFCGHHGAEYGPDLMDVAEAYQPLAD